MKTEERTPDQMVGVETFTVVGFIIDPKNHLPLMTIPGLQVVLTWVECREFCKSGFVFVMN